MGLVVGARRTPVPLRQVGRLAAELPEAELSVRLGRGDARSHIYFSDLTYDYIRINAEYTT